MRSLRSEISNRIRDSNRSGGSLQCEKEKIIAIHKIPGKVIKKNRKAMIKNSWQQQKSPDLMSAAVQPLGARSSGKWRAI